ncbi:DUF3417 domain-containing protein [bacterium]|nr:DUF3417 domain-containing protein [bacterium]
MKPVATVTVVPNLPPALERLKELAFNLRWVWDYEAYSLFRRLDPDLWLNTHHNPVWLLGLLSQERLDAAANGEGALHRRFREGNTKENFSLAIGIEHVADAGGAAVETAGKLCHVGAVILCQHRGDIGSQQQSQIATEASVFETGILLDGVDRPKG